VNSQCKDKDYAKGASPRHPDGSIRIGALLQRGWVKALLGAAVMVALAQAAHAQDRTQDKVAIADPVRTSTVTVTVGKTEDVRTDQGLANITVGDPDVADVSPLTDHSLSILGKKIGTTRVTVYDADKKPVGIFDVEVAYDISRLASEIDHFRQGGRDRARIRPRSDQYRRGDAAAADRARRALHRGRPQRQPRSWRAVEHVR
jgi:Flp pilus assembly secretin CpaC